MSVLRSSLADCLVLLTLFVCLLGGPATCCQRIQVQAGNKDTELCNTEPDRCCGCSRRPLAWFVVREAGVFTLSSGVDRTCSNRRPPAATHEPCSHMTNVMSDMATNTCTLSPMFLSQDQNNIEFSDITMRIRLRCPASPRETWASTRLAGL